MEHLQEPQMNYILSYCQTIVQKAPWDQIIYLEKYKEEEEL